MAIDSLHPETRRWIEEFKSKVWAHATPALAQADTHVMCVIDPNSPALPPGFLPADAASRFTAGIKGEVADEPIVLVLPRNWVEPLIQCAAFALDHARQDGAGLLGAFRAPPQRHWFRMFVMLGTAFELANVHRTAIHPLAMDTSRSGGSAIARAALPGIAELTTDAAVILDSSPAAISLRAALGIQGDDVLHAVERARLTEAMVASDYDLEFEASDLRIVVPAEACAVFVLHRGGTWTGYYLDGGLYGISDTDGEAETREEQARQHRGTMN